MCWLSSSSTTMSLRATWWTPCRWPCATTSALAAGSEADVKLLKELGLDLPEGSTIHADKGYTDYHYEDLLKEVGLHLKAQRKKRSKRPMAAWEEFLSKPTRQYIETVFSNLSAMFSRKIHAVTPRGFELKIVCFLLAFSIQCL